MHDSVQASTSVLAALKTCRACGHPKSLAEFYRHDRMADGHLNQCKACVRAGMKRAYHSNREHYRAYDAARSAKKREWDAKNPEKITAQKIARNALRRGEIVRKTECEKCNGGDTVQMHHDDYSQPLKVKFLCVHCHTAEHWMRDGTFASRKRSDSHPPA